MSRYFTIDITDTVANVTKTFKFWIDGGATNITLSNSNLVF